MKDIDIIDRFYKNLPTPTSTWKYVDNNFILINYNNELQKITDNNIENYLGKKSDQIYETDVIQRMLECYKQKSVIKKDYLNNNKTIRTTYIFVEPDYLIVQSEDISNHQSLVEKYESLNENYLAQNEELDQFTYMASHDLQEPLRTINGFISLLRMNCKDKFDEKSLKYMNYIESASDRMQNMIDDILSYSKLKTGLQYLEKVDLKQLLQEIYLDLKSLVDDGELTLITENLPIIKSDKSLMYSLFQNLITNAVKYRSEELPIIEINWEEDSEYYKFIIQDNGVGIEKEYQDKIFDIFYRLHSKSKYGGTGIGLSICKKIVELHKGKIWVDSVLGIGSTFHFTLKKQI
jgi:light-regulated signal transduction histidine kinase (bacteriophytochrome)